MTNIQLNGRILIAPLDWGLGHATRCIPIVQHLHDQGAEVLLASGGRALRLLQKEFPKLPSFQLPSYRIAYTSDRMFLNMASQLPRLAATVWKEHRKLKTIVRQEQVDTIISDNRFGCFHSGIRSIFITHQLYIQAPFFPLRMGINAVNHWFINKYQECWVPDVAGLDNFSGRLSHPPLNNKVKYIGPLSRMRELKTDRHYDIVAVLSGPEPQRSHLETALLRQLPATGLKTLIVQGKTDAEDRYRFTDRIEVVAHLQAAALNEVMAAAGVIIARPGYSTIMDLAVLRKRAILIPTPGQTEQEYLAARFEQKRVFLSQPQHALDIRYALHQIDHYKGL